MSGHSQFANIKHRKDAQDSKRAKIFQNVTREIFVAVKLGGPSVDSNARLKLVLEKARAINMPKDNVNRAIQKASGNSTENYDEVTYEGYGPFGVGFLVMTLTNNKNRSASNVRSYFNKSEGSLGAPNSVKYLFDEVGVISFNSDFNEEQILDMLLDYELLDLETQGQDYTLVCRAPDLLGIKKILDLRDIHQFDVCEITYLPQATVEISDTPEIKALQTLIDNLENDDDVQHVYHNATFIN